MAAGNKYEEARKLRVEENKKRFQDLGILNISKSLAQLTHSNSKPKQQRLPKPKAAQSSDGDADGFFQPRRSSRPRKPVSFYADDMLDIQLQLPRKRPRINSSWTSYITRPLEEVRLATCEERAIALKAADKFLTALRTGNPSFVKSMVRSHVYSCFWLGLPTQFCKDHLPEKDLDMILVDENDCEYDAKYLSKRTGLSGGWRAFALDHKLDDGDALVFELVEPDRFKVYTFKVTWSISSKEADTEIATDREGSQGKQHGTKEKKSKPKESMQKKATRADQNGVVSKVEKPKQQGVVSKGEEIRGDLNQGKANGMGPRRSSEMQSNGKGGQKQRKRAKM